eukprot:CAMPEP_0178420202 /NCGR_PEP_ID=MMETSP0689_2-20121128/26007_1 /TAXON_ID=160604 /ORGANISM="Amphidinium massartii, Strain CS-259" /LENGTH=209 /DNA_ID=CAMNT_0020041669 /DNA_START=177 /DNA_END=806 /DNA_ORIENTATION=-
MSTTLLHTTNIDHDHVAMQGMRRALFQVHRSVATDQGEKQDHKVTPVALSQAGGLQTPFVAAEVVDKSVSAQIPEVVEEVGTEVAEETLPLATEATEEAVAPATEATEEAVAPATEATEEGAEEASEQAAEHAVAEPVGPAEEEQGEPVLKKAKRFAHDVPDELTNPAQDTLQDAAKHALHHRSKSATPFISWKLLLAVGAVSRFWVLL